MVFDEVFWGSAEDESARAARIEMIFTVFFIDAMGVGRGWV